MGTRHRWIALLILVAVAAALFVGRARPRQPWTTSSPEALEAFQEGLDADMKLYRREAVLHYRRALELDPGFVIARMMLAQKTAAEDPAASIKELRALVKSVDLDPLTPRERFLVRYLEARLEDRSQDAEELLDEYLEAHPKDPYALNLKASLLWRSGQLTAARAAFEKLVELSPNWVVGYNSLGYIAMEQGDFDESEENFSTYKFIAPDQANPFDSLGELYLLTGRYKDAIREFQGALRIKHDFCISWNHLATAYLLDGDEDSARELVQRMKREQACNESWISSLGCSVELFPEAVAHRWEALLRLAGESKCSKRPGLGHDLLIHRAAAMTGKLDLCRKIEDTWKKLGGRSPGGESTPIAKIFLAHAPGVRAVGAGDYPPAREIFGKVDTMLRYRGSAEGLFKLLNLACLAEVQGASGLGQDEEGTVQEIRKVNPAMASAYASGSFRPFGLAGDREGQAP